MSVQEKPTAGDAPRLTGPGQWPMLVWFVFCLVALLALDWVELTVWAVLVLATGLGLALVPALRPTSAPRVDTRDLAVVAGFYLAVVALFRLAFTVFTTDNVLGLFLFAAGCCSGLSARSCTRCGAEADPATLGLGLHRCVRPS